MFPAIEIGGLRIHTIYFFVLLFIVVFLFSFWLSVRKELKTNALFDVAFIVLISSIVTSRLLGMLGTASEYAQRGWSFLPLDYIDDHYVLFQRNPWTFFNFGDGNFLYVGLFFGLIIGSIIVYINSNKQKEFFVILDKLLIAFIVSVVFILIGQFLAGIDVGVETNSFLGLIYTDGIKRMPWQLLQALILIILLVIRIVFAKKIHNRIFVLLFLIVIGLSEIYLRTFYLNYKTDFFSTFDLYQITAIISLLTGIFVLLPINFRNTKTGKITVVEKDSLKRNIEARNFNMSFARKDYNKEKVKNY